MSILDHVTCTVSDFARSKRFYEIVLAPLAIKPLMEFENACGFGREKPEFWLAVGPASFQSAEHVRVITPMHFAFAARTRAEVEEFHRTAVAAGAGDFGQPGLRPHYHPGYFGAFVLDPDGHNIEAVHHSSP